MVAISPMLGDPDFGTGLIDDQAMNNLRTFTFTDQNSYAYGYANINSVKMSHAHLDSGNKGVAYNYVHICDNYVIPLIIDIALSRGPSKGREGNKYYWKIGRDLDYTPGSLADERFGYMKEWLSAKVRNANRIVLQVDALHVPDHCKAKLKQDFKI